jgi:hypothetical protein
MHMSLVEVIIAVLAGGVLFVTFTLLGNRECRGEGGGCGNCSGHCAASGDHDGHA